MATTPGARRAKPFQRIASIDFATAIEVLKAAAFLETPDDQTQHQALIQLMPHLYVLRNNGFSFAQVTNLLTKCGFTLQPGSVRDYYKLALAERMEICQERMNEQILLLAEVRKETKGVNVADIAGRVAAIMNQQQEQAASKLDAVYGSVPAASPPVAVAAPVAAPAPTLAPIPPPAAGQVPPVTDVPRTENTKTGLSPAPPNASPGVSPAIPKKTEAAAARIEAGLPPSGLSTGNWKCSPLPEGVKMLGERDGVTKEMYLPGDLEHPAIPGIWLSLEQRLSSVALEFVNAADGEIQLEDAHQKRFRLLWKTPVPPFKTRTEGSFTKMNHSLFK